MKKTILFSVIFALVLCLIDTAIISHLYIFNWHTDAVLVLILFVSFCNGSLTGSLAAFFSGLGLHSATFVIIAFVSGKMHGRYNLNRVFIPMLLTFIAVMIQSLLFFVLRFIFGSNIAVPNFLLAEFWIGVFVTSISAPILFFLFNLFPTLLQGTKTL